MALARFAVSAVSVAASTVSTALSSAVVSAVRLRFARQNAMRAVKR